MYITVFSLKILTVKELSTERYFIVQVAKLNQHKDILIQNFRLRVCCFGKEILLFSQMIRTCVLYPSGIIDGVEEWI